MRSGYPMRYPWNSCAAEWVRPRPLGSPLIYANPALATPLDPQVMEQQLARIQPIRRAGMPADIAHAALWLASDDSTFVTGTTLIVDGGWTASANTPSDMDDLAATMTFKAPT